MKNEDILKQENGEALLMKKKIDNLYKRSHKLDVQINVQKNKLQDICIHNDTEVKYDYIAGGYLDREVYITKVVCNTCGKELEREEKLGGFG